MADSRSFEELEDAVAAAEDVSQSIMPRRRLEDTEMDITPMIDITFLLLIFFLVAAKMEEGANIALPPAKYGDSVPSKNAVVLTVDMGEPEGPANVYKGNVVNPSNLVDSSDLQAMEEEIESYVEDQVMQDSRKQFILIKAAEKVKHRDVARVTRAASRVAGVQQLHVAVLEVQ